MLKAKDFKPTDLCYTFVDKKGKNTHIASALLREHCLKSTYEVFLAPVKVKLAKSFVNDNVVHLGRVLALTPQQRFEPIIFCKTDPDETGYDVMLVDGHHRYVRAALDKEKYIKAYVLEESQWRDFEIEGLRSTTEEELKAEPIAVKPHW